LEEILTLVIILTNYPATVNKVETLPPIADHDIIYIECITSLRRCQPKPRKIFKYSKANWENINKEFICHNYRYTTMTQTLFVWWSIGPVNSILILWEVFI
jgi:hypothetical protein